MYKRGRKAKAKNGEVQKGAENDGKDALPYLSGRAQ